MEELCALEEKIVQGDLLSLRVKTE